jgi:hypothetical protein
MVKDQILTFFKEHGMARLNKDKWRRGTPLIFVFGDDLRQMLAIRLDCPVDHVSSLARVDNPILLTVPEILEGHLNCFGRVDFYTIRRGSEEIVWLDGKDHIGSDPKQYFVTADCLYAAADSLFPKGPPGA